jgi:predicted short-subunit dehydrogenase-like oxidoreductase (DUF2520 family)
MSAYNISFIGAGNVAQALCAALKTAGHRIVSVASKTGNSARSLALSVGAEWKHDLSAPETCDILVIAVNDDSVEQVSSALEVSEGTVIAHTAGSVPLSALGRTSRAGVFYPLQTFTKGCLPDMKKVPFFIEASDNRSLEILRDLGNSIGSGTWECDSDRRMYIHMAAVFTNNFSNFMMTAGERIVSDAGFDPALLRPLMEETARKAIVAGPAQAQTGPAVRHDEKTIKSHLELLSFLPEYQELYEKISTLIGDYYNKGKK